MKEPTMIKGVVAFPNENGNRDIRFIDAFYNDLFKIPDHSNIVITYLDGTKRIVPCEYIDDTHTDIGGTAYRICAEVSEERNLWTIKKRHRRNTKDIVQTKRRGDHRSRSVYRSHTHACEYTPILECSTVYGISQGKEQSDDIRQTRKFKVKV